MVKAREPATPEAKARTTLPTAKSLLMDMEGILGSTGTKNPIIKAMINPINIPRALKYMDFRARSLSDSTVERANPTLGLSIGAMIMAPIITATLSFKAPMAATREASIMSTVKIRGNPLIGIWRSRVLPGLFFPLFFHLLFPRPFLQQGYY